VSSIPRIATAGTDGGSGEAVPRPLKARVRPLHVIAVAAVVAALIGATLLWIGRGDVNPAIAGSRAITPAELEQDFGVRLGIVGLLASGGLVELKFQVIDADKASALFGESEDMPVLAVEGASTVLESAKGMKHSLTLLDGASYFFLYTNVGNAVAEGTTVAMVFDQVRVPDLQVLR
jgi:hypothetical protein